MGKVKAMLMDAEDFASENYNIPRNEFVAKAWVFAKRNNTLHRHAIEHYDVIQRDLNDYDKIMRGNKL
jgi:hypothetical protein